MDETSICPECGGKVNPVNDYGDRVCNRCGAMWHGDRRLEDSYGDDGDVPYGCSSCGGPYPLCKDGCPAFDDD